MGNTNREPPGGGNRTGGFQEYRVYRSDERVLDSRVGDVADLDDQLGELVGGV